MRTVFLWAGPAICQQSLVPMAPRAAVSGTARNCTVGNGSDWRSRHFLTFRGGRNNSLAGYFPVSDLSSCSCTFHDYDSSILISGICYLLMISTLYQQPNLVSDNCKLRFPLILYTSLLRSPLTAVNMAFKSVKITVLSSSPIVGELTLSTYQLDRYVAFP